MSGRPRHGKHHLDSELAPLDAHPVAYWARVQNTHTFLDRAMDAFSWWQTRDGQVTSILAVDGDEIDAAVLRGVR